MSAEAEIIPNVKPEKILYEDLKKALVNLLVARALNLAECPCDPKMKQERAGQRIAIK